LVARSIRARPNAQTIAYVTFFARHIVDCFQIVSTVTGRRRKAGEFGDLVGGFVVLAAKPRSAAASQANISQVALTLPNRRRAIGGGLAAVASE
jgi:hypothetical protein